MTNMLWNTPKGLSWFLLATMVAVIAAVLAFEHLGGFIPCKLCLEQRQPWYIGIVLMVGVVMSYQFNPPPWLRRGLLALVTILMAYSLFLAIRHTGVEWQWWSGPGDCGAVGSNLTSNASDLLNQLNDTLPPSCDEAAGRFLGLSFAGWNVLASLAALIIAVRAFRFATGAAQEVETRT